MLNLPNRLSIFRILLIPPFVAAIMYYTPDKDYLRLIAAGIFVLAAFTDALDGYIARVTKQRTELGAFLDPLADKMLLVTCFICLSVVSALPPEFKLRPWVAIIVLSRDAIIIVGSALIYVLTGKLDIKPTLLGKATTFFQMSTIFALLLHLPIFPFLMYAMIVFTIVSGLDYIKIGGRVFNDMASH